MSYALSRRTIHLLRAAAGVALASGAALVMSPIFAAAAPPAPIVGIAKFVYTPKEITVAPGTKVVWINHDETPHTIASNDKSFASKGLDTDDNFEHVFSNEGDFTYYCTVHPFMTGVVHVHKQ